MADFEQDFTLAPNNTAVAALTPDVGTAWTYTGTNTDAFQSRTLGGARGCVGHDGAGFDLSDDLASADHQTWMEGWVAASVNHGLCVRLLDIDNWIGVQFAGGTDGFELVKLVEAVETQLISTNVALAAWKRVKAEGDTITLWTAAAGAEPADPTEDTNWTQEGADQTVTDHNTVTRQGIVNLAVNNTRFLLRYRAHTVGAGGGPIEQSHPVVTATVTDLVKEPQLMRSIITANVAGLTKQVQLIAKSVIAANTADVAKQIQLSEKAVVVAAVVGETHGLVLLENHPVIASVIPVLSTAVTFVQSAAVVTSNVVALVRQIGLIRAVVATVTPAIGRAISVTKSVTANAVAGLTTAATFLQSAAATVTAIVTSAQEFQAGGGNGEPSTKRYHFAIRPGGGVGRMGGGAIGRR